MDAKQFAINVAQWCEDRNFKHGTSPTLQFLKLITEFGETSEAIECSDVADTMDGIGDTLVVTVAILYMMGYDHEAWQAAFLRGQGMRQSHQGIVSDPLVVCSSSLGVMANGIIKNDVVQVADGVSGLVKGIQILCDSTVLDIHECMSEAWEEIKDRKGVMLNGTFVKEADLPREVS
jgi:hypothetical protein